MRSALGSSARKVEWEGSFPGEPSHTPIASRAKCPCLSLQLAVAQESWAFGIKGVLLAPGALPLFVLMPWENRGICPRSACSTVRIRTQMGQP